MFRRLSFLICAILLASTVLSQDTMQQSGKPANASSPGNDLEARRKALNDLLKEQWEYTLQSQPIFASIIGDRRYNDKLSDESIPGIKKDYEMERKFLARFQAIDTTGFPEQEALNKELMVLDLTNDIEGEKFEGYLMPVNQMSGIHIDAPQIASLLPFASVKDYDDYVTRLKGFPLIFDQIMERMRLGMQKGLMPPKFLLEKVATQAHGIADQPAEKSPFALPLEKMPKEIVEADQKRIREAVLAGIRDNVLPVYKKFADFVANEYAPKGRTEVGVWSLPDGDARYARAVRLMTTTDMTPEQIHQLGLREVARIEGEMLTIARKQGYSDLKTFNEAVRNNRALKAKSREQILDLYRKYISQMEEQLPKLFGRLPKAKLEVVPVEAFREKEASGAQYQRPAPDGSRPARVQVNTYQPEERTTISMESTAYHEGVPGHHLQLAIQQELPELPPFRQQGGYGAFIEGWALYSERLGKEVGFYQDPYNDYGRLQDEMLRAIRLVVDTGLHYKKWTREQVVQFFHDHSAIDEIEIQNETDRYIVWPGQALSYKVGQLKILELRERAKAKLGDKFDIRQFHDQVLGAGALPMTVLERRLDNWIAGGGQQAKSCPCDSPQTAASVQR
jgi:uncharacterized protein (DUF885 family)